MNKCIECNKKLTGHNNPKRCSKCAAKEKINRLGSSNYKDGRSLNKYYCRVCKKEIGYQTWFYGKKRCQKCFQIGKLNPRYGKHWTKKQLKKLSLSPHKHHIDCNHKNNTEENIIYLSQSGHMKAHGSLNKLVYELLRRQIIKFNIKKAIYQLL
jgi:hypothetical protein